MIIQFSARTTSQLLGHVAMCSGKARQHTHITTFQGQNIPDQQAIRCTEVSCIQSSLRDLADTNHVSEPQRDTLADFQAFVAFQSPTTSGQLSLPPDVYCPPATRASSAESDSLSCVMRKRSLLRDVPHHTSSQGRSLKSRSCSVNNGFGTI